jgi:TatA/E family protein of Tat protein translocase
LFGIGGWEFIIVAVLALLLFGPDKLPQFARTLGRFMRDFKRYQDLMESTIRAEMNSVEEATGMKDVFDTAKEFRERVAGGEFSPSTSAGVKASRTTDVPVKGEEAPPAQDGAAAVPETAPAEPEPASPAPGPSEQREEA